MQRRKFITLLGGAAVAWPLAARAQRPAGARKRLALFSPPEPTALMNEHGANRYWRALFGHLRQLGYVEGQNLVIERFGKEQQDLAFERYGRDQIESGRAALVADVVRSNPDVVYVVGGTVARIFKRATDKIPIVALTGDPVASGLIENLTHPGGNITGVSVETAPSLYGKRIALLREMVPDISKLTYLTTRVAWEGFQGPPMRAAADAAGIALDVSLLELPSSEAAYREAIAKSGQLGVRGGSEGARAFDIAGLWLALRADSMTCGRSGQRHCRFSPLQHGGASRGADQPRWPLQAAIPRGCRRANST